MLGGEIAPFAPPDAPDGMDVTPQDVGTVAVRALLGEIPVVGPVASAAADLVMPQRLDRVVDYVRRLTARIEELEALRPEIELDPFSIEHLIEDFLESAQRAKSKERREYLATMTAAALESKEVKSAEIERLLWLLDQLQDVEVVLLRYKYDPTLNGDTEFRELHADVLEYVPWMFGMPEEDRRKTALMDNYMHHLKELGLWDEEKRRVTPIGVRLLEVIGVELPE